VVSLTPQRLFPREKNPTASIKKEAVCASEQELTLRLGTEMDYLNVLTVSQILDGLNNRHFSSRSFTNFV
jgi:hypothetical protein